MDIVVVTDHPILYFQNETIVMGIDLGTLNRKYMLFILIFVCTFTMASCSSNGTDSSELNDVHRKATETPVPSAANLVVRTTEIQHTSPAFTMASPTQKAASTPGSSDVGLRVSYVTVKLDDRNEVIQSQLWVLYPPYDLPQLLYSTGDGKQDFIISPPVWSHDGKRVAFAQLAGDKRHIAFSVFDIGTKALTQLTDKLEFDQPFNSKYTVKWSNDDRWLYIDYFFNFSNGQIVNAASNVSYKMEGRTQDELVGWSPVQYDQYVSISRKDFPDPGGDILCLHQVMKTSPIKCFEDLDYTLLSGDTFSWSADGEKALIVASDDGGKFSYILLNFSDMVWQPIFVTEYFEPFSIWSSDNQWVALSAYRRGIRFLNMGQKHPNLDSKLEVEYPRLLGWSLDGQSMVYQNGYTIYSVNPNEPSNSSEIIDFRNLLGETYKVSRNYSIDIYGTQVLPTSFP